MPALDLQAARLAGVAAVRAAAVVTEAVRADLQAADSVGKADKSPVTVADFAAQAILVLRLRDAFPAIPVVAEEDADALRESSELCGRVVARVQACPGCEALSPDAILEAIDTGRASPCAERFGSPKCSSRASNSSASPRAQCGRASFAPRARSRSSSEPSFEAISAAASPCKCVPAKNAVCPSSKSDELRAAS